MACYATLHQLKRSLGVEASRTADDDLLLDALGAASRLIDRYTGRTFHPRRQVRAYTVTDPAALLLDDDLLALHGLTNGDDTPIAPGLVRLYPLNGPVYSSLELDRAQAMFAAPGDPVHAIAVDGTWGFHLAWAHAWIVSGDSVQDAVLAADATTLTVADADGSLPDGGAPRFNPGQLIRIGDEYCLVRGVDAVANRLTVTRAAHGTPASEHMQEAGIDIYLPPEDVRQACLRIASWLYKQRDAGFVQSAVGLRGQIAVPPALPDDAQQILGPLVRVRVA